MKACGCDKPGDQSIVADRVQQRKRNVVVVRLQCASRERTGFVDCRCVCRAARHVTKRLRASLALHFRRHLDDGMKQPADVAVLVADRAEGKREKRLLGVAVAIQKDALRFQKRSVSGTGGIVSLADDRPGLAPALREILAQ